MLSKQEFEEKVKTLSEKSRWDKEDRENKSLTWFATKDGIVLANAEDRRIRRFPGMLGLDTFTVNDIAFGPKHVWVASDRGLLAWNRRLGSWSRYAPNMDYLEAAAVRVSLKKGGALEVTLKGKAGGTGTFRRDPEAERWERVD
jgi:hypothetical protein